MKFIKLSLFLTSFAFSFSLQAAELQVRVQSIHDGDTLTAIGVEDGQRYKIRLMGVDTPEVDFNSKSQGDAAFKARDFLIELVPLNSVISISEDSEKDKHGRILGLIISNGVDVNKEMLRQGWGFLYFIYPFDKGIVSDYVQVAKEAYEQKRGVFSEDFAGLEEPYQFRMSVAFQKGRNPVGDFETKKLYKAEDLQSIPVWKRVFFPNSEFAQANGYR
ncbi:Endonuclease YhcR precursor [compost metagenome]